MNVKNFSDPQVQEILKPQKYEQAPRIRIRKRFEFSESTD